MNDYRIRTKTQIKSQVNEIKKTKYLCQTICVEDKEGRFLGLLTAGITPEYNIHFSKKCKTWSKDITTQTLASMALLLKEKFTTYKKINPKAISKMYIINQRLVDKELANELSYIMEEQNES